MKKIFTAIFLFIALSINVKASSVIKENTNIKVDLVKNDILVSYDFNKVLINGELGYYLDDKVLVDSSKEYKEKSIYELPLSEEKIKVVWLLGYYGTKLYNETNDINYYLASQELIWNEYGIGVCWFNGDNNIDLYEYKLTLNDYASKYKKYPAFRFKGLYLLGDNIKINEMGNILNGFEVIDNDNVIIENNSLKINITENNNFTLKSKNTLNDINIYYADNNSLLGTFNLPYELKKEYGFNYTYGKIIIDLYDNETKEKYNINNEKLLKDITYLLYGNNGIEIDKKVSKENGKIIFDNLIKGNYFVRELINNDFYNPYNSRHQISLSSNYPMYTLTIYKDFIKESALIKQEPSTKTESETEAKKESVLETVKKEDNLIENNNKNEIKDIIFKEEIKDIVQNEAYEKNQETIINELKEEKINIESLPNTSTSILKYLFIINIIFVLFILYEKKSI